MFVNWFKDNAGGPEPKDTGFDNSAFAPGLKSNNASAALPPAASADNRPSSTLPLNSPHDAAIDRIEAELRELQAAGTSEGSSPPKFKSRELPENMYDPFDGQSIGLMIPGEFEAAEDDLWTHLAEIRNLQSDIARMHAQMERLGENDGFYGPGRSGEDEAVNAEDEAKAAKAAEFSKLSDRFNRRKEAIDAVMQKLQTLSNSINEFHTSRAPVFRSMSSTDNNKGPNSQAATSSRFDDVLGASANRVLPVSPSNELKESPESMSRSLTDH